jgi:hypothetical protein
MTNHVVVAFALLALATGSIVAAPSPTAFTYQGRLVDGGVRANGSYDLKFTLFDTNNDGLAIAGPLTNSAVAVSNGLFTSALDFGSGVFTGDARWLELGVCTNGGGHFTSLVPRQELTPLPYALYAPSAGTAGSATNLAGVLSCGQLSGTYSNALQFTNSGNSFAGSFAGDGAGLRNVNFAPFAASNTVVVFDGDSKMVDLGPVLTHFPWWKSVAFLTNVAVGGVGLSFTTNAWVTNTASFSSKLTNGTNGVYVLWICHNYVVSTSPYSEINILSNHIAQVARSNWNVMMLTVQPRSCVPSQSDRQSAFLHVLNNWIRSSPLIWRVVDAEQLLPNNYDPTFYNVDTTHLNLVGDTNVCWAVQEQLLAPVVTKANQSWIATYGTNLILMGPISNSTSTAIAVVVNSATTTISNNLVVNGTITGDGSGLTKLNGTAITSTLTNSTSGNAPTATSAAHSTNFWGQLSVTNFNAGTGAGAGTYLRGDGLWIAPPGGGAATNVIANTNGVSYGILTAESITAESVYATHYSGNGGSLTNISGSQIVSVITSLYTNLSFAYGGSNWWIMPTNCTALHIICIGGGGGGGGCGFTSSSGTAAYGGGGGAGGDFAEVWIYSPATVLGVAAGSGIVVTNGGGGAGGAYLAGSGEHAGSNGTNSSFGGFVVAGYGGFGYAGSISSGPPGASEPFTQIERFLPPKRSSAD